MAIWYYGEYNGVIDNIVIAFQQSLDDRGIFHHITMIIMI